MANSADVIDGLDESGSNAVVPPGCFAIARAVLGEGE